MMMAATFGILLFALPVGGARGSEPAGRELAQALSSTATGTPGARFVHLATATNTTNHATYLDHPLTNGDPNALIVVTQNYNPGGVGATYNDHNIGVMYDVSSDRWAVFNQDLADIPIGAAFNVFVATAWSPAFLHTATTGNIEQGTTYIDHPLTNDNPEAMILVTQNLNPGGGGGIANDHTIGVWYSAVESKWAIYNQEAPSMPEDASFNVLVVTGDPTAQAHTATDENIILNYTVIDHPLANENPNAIVLVTQNYNPGGVGGTLNNHAIGVWYYGYLQRWAVFNQDMASMPEGAALNVMVATTDSAAFVHTATAGDITDSYTFIDHPLTNGDPNVIVLVTQNWNPGGVGATYNDHAIGAWYGDGAGKWAMRNQDAADMPPGAAFNVLIPAVDTSVFVHPARDWNISHNWTTIDHPLTNGYPNAIVFVTHTYNPGGGGGVYNNHAIGVWYDDGVDKWAVFNQDKVAMTEYAAFNVFVGTSDPVAFVHTATAGNIENNHTHIDHPLSNGNPNAMVLVTQNWNPGGGIGIYNDHKIGVFWDDVAGKWAIFNQDYVSMPEGAAFNVMVIGHKVHIPLVVR
jgi:hypothetical protein